MAKNTTNTNAAANNNATKAGEDIFRKFMSDAVGKHSESAEEYINSNADNIQVLTTSAVNALEAIGDLSGFNLVYEAIKADFKKALESGDISTFEIAEDIQKRMQRRINRIAEDSDCGIKAAFKAAFTKDEDGRYKPLFLSFCSILAAIGRRIERTLQGWSVREDCPIRKAIAVGLLGVINAGKSIASKATGVIVFAAATVRGIIVKGITTVASLIASVLSHMQAAIGAGIAKTVKDIETEEMFEDEDITIEA